MAQMPDIKPEVNKEPEKKRGLLAGLLGGGGSGGAGIGGLGGSAAGGGLLATKTGILALVLAGTTVAGGIGMVGYKTFGPGESDQLSQNIQLFQAKPKVAAPDANAAASAAGKTGISSSLDGFAKVNAGALNGDTAAAAAAPTDETAASASAASAARTVVSNEVMGAGGNGASKTMLSNTKKLGALSTSFGGGAGSAPSAGSSSKAGDAGSLGTGSKAGQLSGINVMGPGVGAASHARSVGTRARRSGAQNQARFARDMGRQNQSSMAGAGRGFDNSSAGSGTDIGGANTIGMGGAGNSAGEPTSLPPANTGTTNEPEDPVAPTTYDVTPYEKEMERAKMLVLLAAGLLYYASTLAKNRAALLATETAARNAFIAAGGAATPAGIALAPACTAAEAAVAENESMIHYLCYAAAAAGAAVIYYGITIMGGKYDQQSQGQLLTLVGGAVLVGAKLAYAGTPSPAVTLIAAGAGLAAMMGSMLLGEPKTCTSTEEGNADKCTSKIYRSSGSPSEKALEEYLV